jgi:hypothetical protein
VTDEQRNQFLNALTHYLVDNEAMMSVKLELQDPDAVRWRNLRATTPLSGYYPGDDGYVRAWHVLEDFLFGPPTPTDAGLERQYQRRSE